MPIVAGVGYLIVNDILTSVSYQLIDDPVNTTVPPDGISSGDRTVLTYDPGMYVGAQVLVGVLGGNLEVVTITAVDVGTSFSATFANSHVADEPIVGATFPTRQPYDPFYTQEEMLTYLSQAMNDFLSECPLAMTVATVTVAATQQTTALPADSMVPVRVANFKYPLRETSQSNLDAVDYKWPLVAASKPYSYFRDKVGLQRVGIFPRSNATTNLEVVYAQRSPTSLGLADGFVIPDPFLLYPMYRVLAFAYGKDGEQRNPALAKYWQGRYDMGVKVCKMFLEAMMDPSLEMAQ